MDFLCFGKDIVASVSNVPCLSDGMIYGYTLLIYSLSIYVAIRWNFIPIILHAVCIQKASRRVTYRNCIK